MNTVFSFRTYCRRSLLYFWRTNLAVVLGAAVGTAALTGALIVGDSMRASLHEAAVGRLGRVDLALVAPRFFREALADDFVASSDFKRFDHVCPIILLNGGATHTEKRTRVDRVNLFGIDQRFWKMGRGESASADGRSVVLNQALADELQARVGDDVLLRTGKPDPISSETLLGRRDDTVSTLRVTVSAIIPAEGLGAFSLNPRQAASKNAYVPLPTLQRAVQQPDRVNALLVAAENSSIKPSPLEGRSRHRLSDLLRQNIALTDLGLRLRVDESHSYLSLESEAILLPPPAEEAALAAARATRLGALAVLAHLANIIATPSTPGHLIPYSTVAAIEPDFALASSLDLSRFAFNPSEILLNSWAAEDLQAKSGDSITMNYYMTGASGTLETRSTTFTLRGILPLEGPVADPGFIPEYKGITDTENLADWNPPFPVDLRLIRDKDEDYWDKHRTTPKAFVSLADGQRLWAEQPERFGRLTSIRLIPPPGKSLLALADEFSRALLGQLDLERMGFTWDPVRQRVTEASQGNTDFGMLFLGFSSFLILSAMMLVALLFRLAVDRRAHEIGLLLATGVPPRTITGLLLAEGTALALVGAVLGLLGANAYAWLMLAGLRSWWSAAVHSPFLRLHTSFPTMAIGFAVSVIIASAVVAWSIRGMTKRSPRSLLAGTPADAFAMRRSTRRKSATITAIVSFLIAVAFALLATITNAVPKSAAFFLAGASMLAAGLATLVLRLRTEPQGVIHKGGAGATVRLGLRNTPRNPGRSVLTAGLIASATFIIVSLEAFRLDADTDASDRSSGTGGFTLYAESAVAFSYDLGTPDGRKALNLDDPMLEPANDTTIVPFRLRPGDESSCLNLYQPTRPRILGVSDAMIQRGGFRFASVSAESEAQKENPWQLLKQEFPDGAVPAIGDEAAVKWQLHLDLGKDLIVEDERGEEKRLRFVALLKGSVLQSELMVADAQFVRLFPSLTGHAFFLIDAPRTQSADVERALESGLDSFSFDAAPTPRRLNEFLAVQNTYISTFQALGGFGLLLGTAGLAAVMLRNTWERRSELALFRTLGFSRPAIGAMVMTENVALLVFGLLAGGVAAMVALAPVIVADGTSVPWVSLSTTLAAVLLVGVLSITLALFPALRGSVLKALRAE